MAIIDNTFSLSINLNTSIAGHFRDWKALFYNGNRLSSYLSLTLFLKCTGSENEFHDVEEEFRKVMK